MADIVIGASPHIERPFGWKTYYVTPQALTGVADVTIDTLPAETVVLDAKIVTIVAASGVGVVNCDLEFTALGGTALLSDAADGGSIIGSVSAINAPTAANLITVNAASLGGTAQVVNLEITYGGTETIPPTYGVSILCGRNDY